MSLAVRATGPEAMDADDLDPAVYAAVLRDLATVNRMTLAHRPTLAFLDACAAGRERLRILDVGFGAGDMLRAIAAHAARRGIVADLVGIDLNPRSEAVARAATPPALAIDWRTGDYADLAGAGFDLIVSSLVAHHMREAELIAFLRFMDREAAVGWFVNDLRRSAVAHAGFPLLAGLMRWHPIVRADGRLSIARAWNEAEWTALLAAATVSDSEIRRVFPFRLCVAKRR